MTTYKQYAGKERIFFCLAILISYLIAGSAYARTVEQPVTKSDTIDISKLGALPDSRLNTTLIMQAALRQSAGKTNPVIVFPKGRYDFWPQHAVEKEYYESNSTDNNPKVLGIFIEKMNNLVIDGKGSTFIFHGKMQPFTIDGSNGIHIRNITVDWDIPLTAQGEVVNTTNEYIDVEIDEKQYPFIIEDGKLVFVGEGWKSSIWFIMEYEYDTHIITAETADLPLGKNWNQYTAKRLKEGTVRLTYPFSRKPKVRNILIFRHSARDHAAAFIQDSKDIKMEDITFHHCAGLGILSQYSENLDFRKVNFIPNAQKGRYFSGHDDGMHYSNCRGSILVDSCRFAGLMDDPINIHGTYVKIIQKSGNKKLVCRFMEKMSQGLRWARAGEKVGFVDHNTLQTIGFAEVSAFTPLSVTDFEITFTSDIPHHVKIADGIENLSWVPSASISNSFFESCRARGILVSTPKKVVIENNTFNSSGSAILIAGDVNSWYESGAVNDLLIRNNKFLASTMTSLYQFCEAIISLYPEIPVMDANTPPYHNNIRIEGNEFHLFDYPVLFAQSVKGLTFSNNKLIRSYDFKPFHSRKSTFSLIGCSKVIINDNFIDENLLGKNAELKFMSLREIQTNQTEITFE